MTTGTNNRAPIMVDGVVVGAMPASPGAAAALSGTPPQRRLGGDHGSGSGHSRHLARPQHQAPRRTLGGPHTGEHHERHLDPHNRERTAESDKPHTDTVQDIHRAAI
jgi:hypothetical protein